MTEEWLKVIKIAVGGYGIAIIVLSILALFTWAVGIVVQRLQKARPAPAREAGKPAAKVGGTA